MEKKYRFRVSISCTKGNTVLNLRSVKNPQPIEFLELKIPLIISNPAECVEGFDTDYFLDFENSIDNNGIPFGRTYNSKSSQRNILSVLEREIDSHISEALSGNQELLDSEKYIHFLADSGFDLGRGVHRSKYGAPKKAGKVVISRNNKKPFH